MQSAAHLDKDNYLQSFFNIKFGESGKIFTFAEDTILNNSNLEHIVYLYN